MLDILCSASVQPFLRSSPASSPRRYAPTRRRGSTRPNRPAINPTKRIQPAHPTPEINHMVIITTTRLSASHDTPKCRCSTSRAEVVSMGDKGYRGSGYLMHTPYSSNDPPPAYARGQQGRQSARRFRRAVHSRAQALEGPRRYRWLFDHSVRIWIHRPVPAQKPTMNRDGLNKKTCPPCSETSFLMLKTIFGKTRWCQPDLK